VLAARDEKGCRPDLFLGAWWCRGRDEERSKMKMIQPPTGSLTDSSNEACDEFLALHGFVQRVARRLTRTVADADDLTQEFFLKILERPDASILGVRDKEAYLAVALRNAWIRHRKRGRWPECVALHDGLAESSGGFRAEQQGPTVLGVAGGFGPQVVRVAEAWLRTALFKAAARETGLDRRQVKRCLAKVAFELRRAAISEKNESWR